MGRWTKAVAVFSYGEIWEENEKTLTLLQEKK